MMGRRSLLGTPNPPNTRRGTHEGALLPSIRTHYTRQQREALHALAESRPDPITYARERARILQPHYDRKTSERTEQP